MSGLDMEAKCPGCDVAVGDHTIRGWEDCLKTAGFDYELPHEEIPDGPVSFPGIEGELAGELIVGSGMVKTALGFVPCLRFTFVCPGADPMSRKQLKPINLVMSDEGLEGVARLVRNAVKTAITATRRAS